MTGDQGEPVCQVLANENLSMEFVLLSNYRVLLGYQARTAQMERMVYQERKENQGGKADPEIL